MERKQQKRRRPRYVARFAGEAFQHEGNTPDGPMLRKLASEVAWKQSPSAKATGTAGRSGH